VEPKQKPVEPELVSPQRPIPGSVGSGEKQPSVRAVPVEASEKEDWKDMAMRFQAGMENYRKRQRRLAQEEAEVDRRQLLMELLPILDNLDRALEASAESEALWRGVQLTRDGLLRLLRKQGVERIEAQGKSFDPNWHEAVDVVSAVALGVAPGTVARVAQPGYRRKGRLLRPAQVVVAQ
jgi:molecular chaperone GrpE